MQVGCAAARNLVRATWPKSSGAAFLEKVVYRLNLAWLDTYLKRLIEEAVWA